MINGKCCGMDSLVKLLAVVAILNCSAYCETGNPTASGVMPQVGMCAVDKINGEWVKFGTKIKLPDGRILTVTDRFGAGHNNCLDIFLNSKAECWAWGRRFLQCEILP